MNNEKFSTTRRERFGIALILSLFLHGLLGGGLALKSKTDFSARKSKTEVELLNPEEMKALLEAAAQAAAARQIVETDKTRLNDEVDPNAKYLSQYDQKVVKETRAAQTGKFANSAGQGPASAASKSAIENQPDTQEVAEPTQKPDAADVAELEAFENGDIEVEGATTARQDFKKFTPNFRKMPLVPDPTAEEKMAGDGNEISKSDDHLKEVPTGMQTMLSTREFVYYSYYNRIKDKLRQYWEPKIREKFERTLRQGRQIASEGDKITKVVIILDEKGTLIRVQVLSASGLVDLDEAAVEAFRAAAPFPNPPKGIVEEDGTIKIRWDFVLEA